MHNRITRCFFAPADNCIRKKEDPGRLFIVSLRLVGPSGHGTVLGIQGKKKHRLFSTQACIVKRDFTVFGFKEG
jgi:hypothetical protein